MKTTLKVLALSCLFLSLTGCASMSGRWNFDSITPQTAKKDFQLQCMYLKDDGTFTATASEAGKTREMSGTYTYDGATKTLKFMSQGKEYKYNAELTSSSDTMKVWGGEKGREWTAYMKRVASSNADEKRSAGAASCAEKK